MSDTEAMVRLMDNAAEHLRAQINGLTAEQRSGNLSAVAAMAYARGVLQMVSASVAPEGASAVNGLIGSLTDDIYGEWAETSTGVAMSPVTLEHDLEGVSQRRESELSQEPRRTHHDS